MNVNTGLYKSHGSYKAKPRVDSQNLKKKRIRAYHYRNYQCTMDGSNWVKNKQAKYKTARKWF